jgi:hypothetical protein
MYLEDYCSSFLAKLVLRYSNFVMLWCWPLKGFQVDMSINVRSCVLH